VCHDAVAPERNKIGAVPVGIDPSDPRSTGLPSELMNLRRFASTERSSASVYSMPACS
jgi:hypothetical protein